MYDPNEKKAPPPRPTAAQIIVAQGRVDAWNAANPVGTPIEVQKDDGSLFETKTRSGAWLLTSDRPVVLGMSGFYALERVRPSANRK
jgi:hypothetical protein